MFVPDCRTSYFVAVCAHPTASQPLRDRVSRIPNLALSILYILDHDQAISQAKISRVTRYRHLLNFVLYRWADHFDYFQGALRHFEKSSVCVRQGLKQSQLLMSCHTHSSNPHNRPELLYRKFRIWLLYCVMPNSFSEVLFLEFLL